MKLHCPHCANTRMMQLEPGPVKPVDYVVCFQCEAPLKYLYQVPGLEPIDKDAFDAMSKKLKRDLYNTSLLIRGVKRKIREKKRLDKSKVRKKNL